MVANQLQSDGKLGKSSYESKAIVISGRVPFLYKVSRMEDQQYLKNLSGRNILSLQVHQVSLRDIMHFATCTVLLLMLVWPVSTMPVLFCQNTERQIESILNLLQTIRKAAEGTPFNLTKLREREPISNTDKCALVQRLTNYQACDLDFSPEIGEISYMKAETKGLVDNLQSFKNAGCVLSPAVCPYSHLSMWSKIDVLLNLWSQDVAACNNALQSMCSPSNYNSV